MSQLCRRARGVAAPLALMVATFIGAARAQSAAGVVTTETILFVRHGEKPADGLGQLSCKGLNRALALPAVIAKKYGKVDAVFAPDPSHQKPDGEASYDYIRPLATVEPTAIRFGLPVQASLGYSEIDPLRDALLTPSYRNATVLVGWEHHALNAMVPKLVASLGGKDTVPDWAKDDFDSIWRLTIERTGGTTTATFAVDREGLDGQPDTCPN